MRGLDRRVIASAVTTALLAAGCGGDDDFANEPRPPAPVVVTAAIVGAEVSVSPARLGAGPIELIITNQTDAAQQIVLESRQSDRPLRQETPPINPNGTAQIKLDIQPGTYRVTAGAGGIRAATLRVGAQRESAQDQLLQP
jgi:hypothetical protein